MRNDLLKVVQEEDDEANDLAASLESISLAQADEPSDLVEIKILSVTELRPSADANLELSLMLKNVQSDNIGNVNIYGYMVH